MVLSSYSRCPISHSLGPAGCTPIDECLTAPCLHDSTCTAIQNSEYIPSSFSSSSDSRLRFRRSSQFVNSSLFDLSSMPLFKDNSSDLKFTTEQDIWSLTLDGEVGFKCQCGSWYSGRYCEWVEPRQQSENHVGLLFLLGLLITAALFGKLNCIFFHRIFKSFYFWR